MTTAAGQPAPTTTYTTVPDRWQQLPSPTRWAGRSPTLFDDAGNVTGTTLPRGAAPSAT